MKNLSSKSLLAAILLSCFSLSHAGPAAPGQLQLKNQDGQAFRAQLKGDEWFSWVETPDGLVSVKNSKSGDFEYARLKNGQIVPSGIKTTAASGVTAPSIAPGLTKANDAAFRAFLKKRQQQPTPATVYGASGVTSTSPIISGQGHNHGPASQWNHLTAPPATVPLLVVILEFNDQQLRSPVATWSQKIFGESPGQMNYFYKTVSNGKFKFTPAVETQDTVNDGIMKVRLAMNHPNHGSAVGTTERFMALDQLDGFINYASFDTNGDRILQKEELQIIYLYAGGESSSGSSLPSVWAHKTADWNLFHDGVDLQNNYSRFGERHFSPPDDRDATYGIIAHELGHATFNLPDLYDYDGSSGGADNYCLMSGGSWGSAPTEVMGSSPTAPSAWVRYRLGFTDATTVTPGTPLAQTLKPQSHQGKITLIPTESPAEYFLVENRYPDGTDISLSASGPGGAMIWHIDETQTTNTDDARRLADYEENPTYGQPQWPQTGMTAFTTTSIPNSKDNGGVATGVHASAFTRLSDVDYSVSFTAEKRLASVYPAMYFRGTPNNWGSTPMTLISPGVWETTQSFTASTVNPRFKFDLAANWVTSWGDTNKDGILEQGGADILVTPGTYAIRFFESNMRYGVFAVNLPPVAKAGPDQIVTVDQLVQFDGSTSTDPDGTIVTYTWNNGLTGARPTLYYSTAGVYIVELTVTDNSGANATDSVIIDVRPPAPNQSPTARIAALGTVPAGQLVVFDGRASSDPEGAISSYTWTINGAATTLSGPTPGYTFSSAGTYVVGLTVTDINGAVSPLASITVTVSPAGFTKVYPQVYYRGTSNGWAANTVMSLVGNNLWSTTVAIPTTGVQMFKFDVHGDWTLSFGDNNADGLAEQGGGNIAIPAGGGTYVFTFNDSTRRYTLSKQGGNQLPVPVVPATQAITGAGTLTLNGLASYDPDGTITAFQWTQISGPTLTISNATQASGSITLPTVTAVTSYRFRLTVTDNAGATAFAEQVITQNPVQTCTPTYTKMGLRGTSNGWATTAMTQSTDCFWQTTAVFGSTTTERFKFDVNGDWAINFGDTNKDGIAEAAGADITVTQGAGTYLIRFNDGTKRYTVTKQ